MSEEEMIAQRELLNEALNASFKKMLEMKKKLGQTIVTVDSEGHTIELTAEEAEELLKLKLKE